MCNDLLQFDGQESNYSKTKFTFDLIYNYKTFSEIGPRSDINLPAQMCDVYLTHCLPEDVLWF